LYRETKLTILNCAEIELKYSAIYMSEFDIQILGLKFGCRHNYDDLQDEKFKTNDS